MKGSPMYTSPSARVSAASAYQQVGVNSQVMGASPHGLISLLFHELIKCLTGAKTAMQSKDVPLKVRLMAKSARLIDEGLMSSLDTQAGGKLAGNLHRLYSYSLMRLAQANSANDVAMVDEVLGLLQPVMDSWDEIGKQMRG